jgi:hypothetical protein
LTSSFLKVAIGREAWHDFARSIVDPQDAELFLPAAEFDFSGFPLISDNLVPWRTRSFCASQRK